MQDLCSLHGETAAQDLDNVESGLKKTETAVSDEEVKNIKDLQFCLVWLWVLGLSVHGSVEELFFKGVDKPYTVHKVSSHTFVSVVVQQVTPRQNLYFPVPDDELFDLVDFILTWV